MKNIVIFDPKNIIFSSKSAFERHQYYAQKLYEADSEALLTVMTFRNVKNNIRFNLSNGKLRVHQLGLNIYSKKNRFFLSRIDTLIFGEPFISPTLFRFLYLFYFCPKNLRIQIQFHGDFFQSKWRNSFKKRLKYFLIRININKATTIRLVSQKQLSGFKEAFPKYINYVVAPIVVTKSNEIIGKYGSNRPNVVGFLGRIDHERGIDTLESIIRLFKNESNIRFLIAGNGKLLDHLRKNVVNIYNARNVEIIGFVEQENLEELFWSRIGILISTAPMESYGLTMREAVIRQIPVLTLRNSGSLELEADYPDACIEFYESDNISYLVSKIPDLIKLQLSADFSYRQTTIDNDNLSKLFGSWLST